MKLRNRILGLAAACVLALGSCAAPAANAPDYSYEGKLVILHTNDIHGRASGDVSDGTLGYAVIAQYKKDLEARGASVLLLDAGDASQGTPVVNLTTGKAAIEFMNASGYDAMAPGNHEFDWGSDNFLANVQEAKFPVISANIVNRATRELIFEPNVIFTASNGTKVGVFGLTTPETLTKTHPDKVKNVDFLMGEDLYKCAKDQVDYLKGQGCTVIVCLGHLGVADESEPNRSTDVIAKVSGIDLFIDGHSHTLFENGRIIGSTLLVSTGEYGTGLGVAVYDGKTFSSSIYRVAGDPDVAALVSQYAEATEAELGKVFARTTVRLVGDRQFVRTQETNLGDFAADAILWQARSSAGDDIAGAITNGGGIRASIEAGDITMNTMKLVFPFGNTVAVVSVTGQELLEALEAATFSTPEQIGAFPQVSGIVFEVNTAVPYEQAELYPDTTYYKPANPGSRVTVISVGGEPFDAGKIYRIATNDFMAAGGDTYYAFKYAGATARYDTGVSLEDALVNYTAEVLGGVVSGVYAAPQGRITVK